MFNNEVGLINCTTSEKYGSNTYNVTAVLLFKWNSVDLKNRHHSLLISWITSIAVNATDVFTELVIDGTITNITINGYRQQTEAQALHCHVIKLAPSEYELSDVTVKIRQTDQVIGAEYYVIHNKTLYVCSDVIDQDDVD